MIFGFRMVRLELDSQLYHQVIVIWIQELNILEPQFLVSQAFFDIDHSSYVTSSHLQASWFL